MTVLPPPADAARVSRFLADHPRWSAFWDKRFGVWRVAEDDPPHAAPHARTGTDHSVTSSCCFQVAAA